jgi:hypothetical protein
MRDDRGGGTRMEQLIYQEMTEEEKSLDWFIATTVLSDSVLLKTLQERQAGNEKHAIIAVVENGALKDAYVSPESAVIKDFPFDQVRHAFEYYEIGDEICLVIVRDNKVVISIRGD